MDLRLSGAAATEVEREAIDAVLGPAVKAGSRVVRGGHRDRERRHLLLPALHALQDRVGWVSRGATEHLAERLAVAPAEIHGVASFYHLLATHPGPKTVVHVCDDVACLAAGAGKLFAELDASGAAWKRSPCLGHCEHGSAALVRRAGGRGEALDVTLAPVTASQVTDLLAGGPAPSQGVPDLPAPGEFRALRRARELGPDGVLAELAAGRLVGRGGAAFATARKWEAVARSQLRPRYVVCNADESEPGTFKDRVLLERDPYQVLEAMQVCGHVVGAERGFIYIRDEYPRARSLVAAAIERLRAGGLLEGFEIELRRGAGAYVCGEETSLFNSIEGHRGEPRNRPPFPVERGLFGRPTVINNVETLVAVARILEEGGEAYGRLGTAGSAGTKLFCVSGAVERPGLQEVEFGATLGQLIELAGGVRSGHTLQAVLLGGTAGSLVGAGRLDLPLTLEATREAKTTIGSGAVVVFDETSDLGEVAVRIARFFREESCGQCVPCRVGTVRQEEALRRLFAGRPLGSREEELVRLKDIAQVMRDASICGLGQTAANAVQSALVQLGMQA
ncbi:MAG TPA: NADH-ubiquinone oxidoreductase-F iron-sulfur binding region domain-containing protein [Candidatus Dormibacteraeota bacterium]|nr:NADH-ubiquinone oxidoreductase-F iron-sulfur binding region domain-containing protein [Candidatus Dormibacteraeota bacterium]